MKGKKVDTDFVSQFITESCDNGKVTPAEIVKFAQEKISEIDIKLMEVELLKKKRSKLLDVVIVFNRNSTKGNQLDEVLLNFYRIDDKKIAANICENIFKCETIPSIKKTFPTEKETFIIRQLLEYNILYRSDETIKAGVNFPAFKAFLKENYETR